MKSLVPGDPRPPHSSLPHLSTLSHNVRKHVNLSGVCCSPGVQIHTAEALVKTPEWLLGRSHSLLLELPW